MTALTREDSAALGDALRKVLQDHYDFGGARRRALAGGPNELPPLWHRLAALGLTGLLLPETHGGFGAGAADLQQVQAELGRALVVAPWFDGVLAAQAILLAGTPAQRDAWLPGAQPSGPMAWAGLPPADGPGGASPLRARRTATGWQLDGGLASVPHAGCCARLVVAAQLPQEGAAWFVVDGGAPGLERSEHRLLDNGWAADLRFAQTAAELLGPGDVAPAPERAAQQQMLQALAGAGRLAEAVGSAQAALEDTVRHLRTRKQFGQALGDYQALRHRVAEMYIALEQARSAADLALQAVDGEPALRSRRAAQAQLVGCETVTWILQQAIQLHGGMGMTDELAVGHRYRRMLVLNVLSGGASGALASLVAQDG